MGLAEFSYIKSAHMGTMLYVSAWASYPRPSALAGHFHWFQPFPDNSMEPSQPTYNCAQTPISNPRDRMRDPSPAF